MLLSDTYHGSSPRLLFIYKRWISTIFVIEGSHKIKVRELLLLIFLSTDNVFTYKARSGAIIIIMLIVSFCVKGDGSGSFLLRMNSSSGGGTLKNMKFAKYTIARECLHLEGIDKDSEK